MRREGQNMERKRWVAAVMSLIMPGLGQVYNGELFKGVSFLIIFIFIPLAGFRFTVYLQDKLFLVGVIITLGTGLIVYVLSIVDAYRKSRELGEHYNLKAFNRLYCYVAAWMIGTLLFIGTGNYTRDNSIQAFKIPSLSMEPAILRGDMILVDKTAYRRMSPEIGDIAVFVFPDDRSKFFIKRIAGLPGDVVEVQGRQETVPHGAVYVLKDNVDSDTKYIDSRDFGFVQLRDLSGKARLVYYSSGPDGIRWDRIGLTFGQSSQQ